MLILTVCIATICILAVIIYNVIKRNKPSSEHSAVRSKDDNIIPTQNKPSFTGIKTNSTPKYTKFLTKPKNTAAPQNNTEIPVSNPSFNVNGNQYVVHAEYSSESLYDELKKNELVEFVKKYVFVNADFFHNIKENKLKIVVKGHDSEPLYRRLKWNDIKCEEVSENVKTNPCTHRSNPNAYNTKQKIFWYKNAHHLLDYITKLKTNVITKEEHTKYFDFILGTFQNAKRFYNNNTEVKILHIKLHDYM